MPDNVSGYHDGRQVQWGSKFSTPSLDGQTPPNGTLSPANLDSLGARWMLDTGNEPAQSGQGKIKVNDSGRVGLRIDPTARGDIVNGQRFHLEMTLPDSGDGYFLISLFAEDKNGNARGSLNLHGVPEVAIAPVSGSPGEFAAQFEIRNDSGGPLILEYELGDLIGTDNLTDIDVRFSAAVIQYIPEPTSMFLVLLGLTAMLSMGRRR